MNTRKLTARAFMETLSTAGREEKPDPEVKPVDPHPPVIVERWELTGPYRQSGHWVEKRMEWDGKKYVEVVK